MKRIGLASLICFSLVACACNSEVPIGEGQPDGGGSGGNASGGAGGNAGQAGQGATGGTAGSGGTTETGGSGGSAGSGGTSETGGSGGSAGSGGTTETGGSGGSAGAGGSGGTGGLGGSGGSTACGIGAITQLQVLAQGWPMPRGVALDDTTVYFANWGHGSGMEPAIVSVPKSGGSSNVLGTATMYPAARSAFAGPDVVVAQGDALFVRAAFGNEVWRMPKAGGQPQPVFTNNTDPMMLNAPPSAPSYGMGVDGSAVYFPRTHWTALGSAYDSGVYRVPSGGGSVETIVAFANTIAAPAGHTGTVVLDGATLLWVHWNDAAPGGTGAIDVASTSGSTPAQLVQTGQVQGMVSDGSHVYYAHGGFVNRVAKTGGAPTALAQAPGLLTYVYGVALDADYVYVTFKDYGVSPECGGVLRIAKSDGATLKLATAMRPSDIVVDSTAVYYSDLDEGTVNRVLLP